MSVDNAAPDDIVSWLEIVREVEPLFGPMPDFGATLAQKIGEGDALCVRASDGAVVGAMLLGGTAEHGWIRWLAVRRAGARAGDRAASGRGRARAPGHGPDHLA